VIRLLLCIRKAEHVDPEAFQRWLRSDYPALLAQSAEALHLARYSVLDHQTGNASDSIRSRRGTDEPYDAVVEMWWPSRRELYAAGLTPEGIRADARLIAAESEMVDHRRSVAIVTDDESTGPPSER
jgi:hypothetical protein